ncbi:septin CDC3 PWA37_000572 [Arxiozyma heterogenica]|uniref:Septin-type G domain-containing protein n=1 Tax=Arxiozyma heterogenica TaxID=278026 RepID=A0AAN8AA27_9SACH|nr:hypothetical protein RI543_000044 [Kazachstania heterogenica]
MSYPEDKISIKREESNFTGVSFPPRGVATNHDNNNKNNQSLSDSTYQQQSIKQEPVSPQDSFVKVKIQQNQSDDNEHDDEHESPQEHNGDHINNNNNNDLVNEQFETLNTKNNVGQVLPIQPNLKIIKRQITNYVGFANLPKQWHRKSIRNGFNFNLLCVGKSGLGKTTLINSLFNQEFNDSNTVNDDNKSIENINNNASGNQEDDEDNLVKINIQSSIIEENGVRLKLTVIETPGFGNHINNNESWNPIIQEINHRYDQYLDHENKINRTSFDDMRIHACLYFIEPTGHCLTPLDLKFCSQVHKKCNLIPVISKSDIMSDEEIIAFKTTIMKQFNENGIDLFQPPMYKLDDEDTREMANKLYESLPYAVVGSNDFVPDPIDPSKMIRARQYPWGLVEVENSKHSDFQYLRDLLIRQYLEELRERTDNVLYENYRSNKLVNLGIKQDNSVFKEFDPLERQEEERKLHEAKLAKLESEMKSVFQQKVNEKEKKLQKSETELFARHKEMKEKLLKQLKALEEKKHQLEMSISSQMNQASPVPQKKKGFLR